jgi:DNA-entry nuclease
MIGTGTSARHSIKPAGFGGQKSGHARGHLLGNQLGGSGDDVRNLVTIYQNPVPNPGGNKLRVIKNVHVLLIYN